MAKNTKSSSKDVQIIPLLDRVLLEEIEDKGESKTAAGIILPESTKDNDTKKAKVVAVGEGRKVDGELQKPQVSVGDTVIYSWGDKIEVEGKKYIIVDDSNIKAIVR